MRTIELRAYYQILSELNNSFTHYSLVWNQFEIDYTQLFKDEGNTLTQDFFVDNPFKRKHNIRFRELENEHIKTHDTLIKGIFLLIYTHFEDYLKQVLLFAQKVDNSILAIENKLEDNEDDYQLLDKVLNRIGISKESINQNILITLNYIRLKRNRLIHSNVQNISKSLNEIVKTHGDELNEIWNGSLASNLQGIDFSDKENANHLSFSVIIDIINILRGISSEIDKNVILKLTEIKIAESVIIPSFIEIFEKRINGLQKERLKNKFKRYCDSTFALEVDKEIMELFERSIA